MSTAIPPQQAAATQPQLSEQPAETPSRPADEEKAAQANLLLVRLMKQVILIRMQSDDPRFDQIASVVRPMINDDMVDLLIIDFENEPEADPVSTAEQRADEARAAANQKLLDLLNKESEPDPFADLLQKAIAKRMKDQGLI